MKSKYPRGFNVHFEPIPKSDPMALYRTAEYLASGFFHNSSITTVDHDARTVAFRYRSRLDARTREKRYAHLTLSVHEFMARMLYYLPDHHQKSLRYYGFYASTYRRFRIEKQRDACSWVAAISNSSQVNPVDCPDCGRALSRAIPFAPQARRFERTLRRNYRLLDGYFRPIRPDTRRLQSSQAVRGGCRARPEFAEATRPQVRRSARRDRRLRGFEYLILFTNPDVHGRACVDVRYAYG